MLELVEKRLSFLDRFPTLCIYFEVIYLNKMRPV